MSKIVQLKPTPTPTRATRIHALLKDRDAAEAEIAAILREQLHEVGEAEWLAWCGDEFGWARSTSYRHLNPQGPEKARIDTARRERAMSQALRHEPRATPPPIGHYRRADGEIRRLCDFNPEDAADAGEPGDSAEVIRHRIFLHHANEAQRHALENGFDAAVKSEITRDIMRAAKRAATAWADLVIALNKRAGE